MVTQPQIEGQHGGQVGGVVLPGVALCCRRALCCSVQGCVHCHNASNVNCVPWCVGCVDLQWGTALCQQASGMGKPLLKVHVPPQGSHGLLASTAGSVQ